MTDDQWGDPPPRAVSLSKPPDPATGGVLVSPSLPAPAAPREPWVTRGDLIDGAAVVGALAIAGVLGGLVWRAWSPRILGYVYQAHVVIPDEKEALIASDGRFLVITAILGALAGTVGWRLPARRGPVTVAALALGAGVGAVLTDVTGRLTGGGHADGRIGTVITLPVQVRAGSLLAVEALIAVIVYALCAAFAVSDDLGRTERLPPPPEPAPDHLAQPDPLP